MNNTSPLTAIRRRWWLVVAFALLGALVGWLPKPAAVEEQATVFTGTNTLLASGDTTNSTVSVSQITLLATAGEVPRRVAEELDFSGNPAELAAQIEVVFDFEAGALTITTEQETAERAEVIANTFADELNSYIVERQDAVYQDRVAASRQRLAELETRLNEISVALEGNQDDPILTAERDAVSRQYGLAYEQNDELERSPGRLTLTTLERAQAVPEVDSGLSAPTSRSTRGVMGLLVGATIGALVAIVAGRVDRKIRTREAAEEIMGTRARVVIPKVSDTGGGIVVHGGRHDPLSDSYRTVRNVVGFVQSGLPEARRARVTLVVSPGPGDGKTSLSANLAAAFVETGQRTVAVNADFRRPRLGEAILGAPPPELPFTFDELDALPRRVLLHGTELDHLKLLDLNSIDASPIDLARATLDQVGRIADSADQIVIDTSPVGATAEVLEFVPSADVIVIVSRVGHTNIEAAQRTIAILRDIATAPLIFVAGGIKLQRTAYYEYGSRRRPAALGGADEAQEEHELKASG
jgi:Mrp family chromosome partitioning ATPase